MNLILLKPTDFIKTNLVKLDGRRFNHLKKVNKVKKNDQLVCGVLNGKMGTAIVNNVLVDSIELQVTLTDIPPKPIPLTLVLALPRPKMLKRIIESVTSLGVKDIYLINSWRVEKSFWQSPVLKQTELEKFMILGLEQSKDTILPTIHLKRFFKGFVNDELPMISKESNCITAHPKSSLCCPIGINEKTTLAIGPEGGFIEKEIQTLKNIGFSDYHVGDRILKVETAVTYLISRLFNI